MFQTVLPFYDQLARFYHLIFEDWEQSIARQAQALDPLLKTRFSQDHLRILDCACGIGTQAIGLALKGHSLVASDVSSAAIARAAHEAKTRELPIDFYTADMTDLAVVPSDQFDVVAALDNALPHLNSEQLLKAARSIKAKLRPGGLFIASLRNYEAIILERPNVQPPSFYGAQTERRIVHQIWDWKTNDTYAVHLYLTILNSGAWKSHHFTTDYRCLLRAELNAVLETTGFTEIEWIMPDTSRFYQPIVIARNA